MATWLDFAPRRRHRFEGVADQVLERGRDQIGVDLALRSVRVELALQRDARGRGERLTTEHFFDHRVDDDGGLA